ncbi:MAG: electron transport complex subunit RsxB [Gammaproteobacteria bacterium]|uniref:electron transport complex subunit RsxB n=1 Tax=Rhodoferax sp. TaxID=50421 RepID=UPI0017BA1EC8|nr:electron transport complex subunit RsxB [Rhodoferax sp.]MBU3899606.1 electron transport complex subunit RsxB [Gammaproteobacteria bacterium]MBA3056594.1 electron transport complex subunit RsxB [Rhodoferax sp.]MBU3998937.1 electron transport complex subunit RsxB [Gammaproteobacteria bacterium]MBU4018082.1 electron transport complex subunit RsxB [Gammaproteobacteria bacterium]MBU4080227.1 electron transport complex subunit RsxB [Gammaproteobacteria bacterium]
MNTLTARILAVLPQTQCTRCGYPDCAAYAQAVATGAAGINQCPPGGAQGVAWLASITGKPVQMLNPVHGVETARSVAFINENWCIGCTLCIDACPTDAIFGSNKVMHTVIEAYCTGCELCLPVCPVDCIALENVSAGATGWRAWSREQADLAQSRYEFSSYRRSQNKGWSTKRLEEKTDPTTAARRHPSLPGDAAMQQQKSAVIDAALARARVKRDATVSAASTQGAAPLPLP